MAQNTPRPNPPEPVELPDVATQAHPGVPGERLPASAHTGDNAPEAGDTKLQDVLPQMNELALKVGGFKKLAELATTLDKMNK